MPRTAKAISNPTILIRPHKPRESKGNNNASPPRASQAQPHQQPSPRDAAQHDRLAAQARGDQDHAAEGEGAAQGRRAHHHARQEPTLANKRLAFDRLRDRDMVVKLFDELGPALQGAQRRLPAHPQVRLPPGRQRADGAGRAGGPPARQSRTRATPATAKSRPDHSEAPLGHRRPLLACAGPLLVAFGWQGARIPG